LAAAPVWALMCIIHMDTHTHTHTCTHTSTIKVPFPLLLLLHTEMHAQVAC
jgi:hypothetical protein